ncbi:hypothetical protein K7432_017572 [Basidiobolus ranarum]|uniref:Uncharacterized protein n=1 Tax=Basidiobolus ranarum TaxID=34480 RepID=A0ABR2WD86_9FUNG
MDELYINVHASTGYIQASLGSALDSHDLMNQGERAIKFAQYEYNQLKVPQQPKPANVCFKSQPMSLYLENQGAIPATAV